MKEFAGEFEIHLTVLPAPDLGIRQWARERGAKYTRIVLDSGATPDQPMLTWRARGTLSALRRAAHTHAEALRRAGLEPTRIKLEAAPWNEDVPRTEAEAAELHDGCYFEHHLKLLLHGSAAVPALRAVTAPHGARVSRNARRALDASGRHERFVTQRRYGVGRADARRDLDMLRAAVFAAGYEILEAEEEFVVLDDNPAVDAGWLDAAGVQPVVDAGRRG
ncbi:hypothetical protein AB0M28_16850 [Streptomyces sp. NPDC051940]|uniref:hypothetical protein n=1 Tax=Streptomyces sp. NPDC051940 TaxID=3155675 RepID=UPI00342E0613